MRDTYQRARQLIHAAKHRMKQRVDAHRVLRIFAVGDLVVLNTRNLSIKHPTARGKLLPRWVGPFKVLALVGKNAVKLALPSWLSRIHHTVHVSIIKVYHPRNLNYVPPPTPCVLDGELEWEVQNILDHRYHGTEVEFLIDWVGATPEEATFQPAVDLANCVDTLVSYVYRTSKRTRQAILRRLPKKLRERVESKSS